MKNIEFIHRYFVKHDIDNLHSALATGLEIIEEFGIQDDVCHPVKDQIIEQIREIESSAHHLYQSLESNSSIQEIQQFLNACEKYLRLCEKLQDYIKTLINTLTTYQNCLQSETEAFDIISIRITSLQNIITLTINKPTGQPVNDIVQLQQFLNSDNNYTFANLQLKLQQIIKFLRKDYE